MRRRVGVVGTSRSVSMSVFMYHYTIKRSVSSVTKEHEDERSTKKEKYSVTMHMEKTGVT